MTQPRRKMVDYATELEWLRFFRKEALVFNSDLYRERMTEWIRRDFEKHTGKTCPERT
jgi:hypothetical protein